MTPIQSELREERLVIMMAECVTKEDAEVFCDSCPELYGIRDREKNREKFNAHKTRSGRNEDEN